MARAPSSPLSSPLWSRRLTEWCLVALILVALGLVFTREIRTMQGQSERIQVWSTVASLRTGLMLNRLAQQVRPDDLSLIEKNPFLLLQHLPPNYAGAIRMRDVHSVPPASWVFDPECNCVGYRLMYSEWLEPAQEADAIWFQVDTRNGAARLAPRGNYRWFGQPLI